MEITIQTVATHLLRNDQIGDWVYGKTRPFFVITVSNKINDESKLAVAIHELIEAFLCKKSGIEDAAVCKFDKMFEDERKHGHHPEEAEPGDDPRSPYREEHQHAEHVEKAVCVALGITWEQHVRNCSGQPPPETATEEARP